MNDELRGLIKMLRIEGDQRRADLWSELMEFGDSLGSDVSGEWTNAKYLMLEKAAEFCRLDNAIEDVCFWIDKQ